MSFDVNITVNGNRCKQYQFEGKTFIEAKHGSEYVIEIKNNYYKRVLAVSSVDGLNVLTGKTASEADSGYIIGSHSAEKIKGFRYSDNEWALFKFGYKFNGNTYAQSKGDGSEKNCGVIGVKFFYEKDPVVTYFQNIPWSDSTTKPFSPTLPKKPDVTWYSDNITYSAPAATNTGGDFLDWIEKEETREYSATKGVGPTKGGTNKISKPRRSTAGGQSLGGGTSYNSTAVPNTANFVQTDFSQLQAKKEQFDMGTEWGRREESKVRTVAFEKGALAQTFEIFYASRESLIEMGVIVENKLQANLPQSFPSQYAEPPKGWRG